MSASLPFRVAAALSHIRDERSPTHEDVDPRVGALGLAVTDLVADSESVGFVVRLSISLDAERYADFKYIEQALVVTVEEPQTRRAAAFRLIDPHMPYLEPASPNYRPPDGPRSPSPVLTTSYVNAPIQVRCEPLRAEHERPWRGLWVQATLQTLRSTRIHVHPRNG